MVGKIGRLAQFLHQEGSPAMIEVDGGITTQNLAQVYQAGGAVICQCAAQFSTIPRALRPVFRLCGNRSWKNNGQ
jgi:pentose-5-phosphate-3-epimerase